jgi:hypothetical protein
MRTHSNAADWSKPRVVIIGLGVKVPEHTTVEARRAMADCAVIYSIVQQPPKLWLPADRLDKTRVINALDLYAEGAPRAKNYEQVARTIHRSLQSGGNVGYVTYGNPMAFDSVAQHLIRLAGEDNTPFEIIPGISSVDTILCDLNVDMAPGIQIVEASWLVAYKVQLHLNLPVLLLQIGAYGSTQTHYKSPQSARVLSGLSDYLSAFYPATHRGVLVRSAGEPRERVTVLDLSLNELSDLSDDDLGGASFYIPALDVGTPDAAFISEMEMI